MVRSLLIRCSELYDESNDIICLIEGESVDKLLVGYSLPNTTALNACGIVTLGNIVRIVIRTNRLESCVIRHSQI